MPWHLMTIHGHWFNVNPVYAQSNSAVLQPTNVHVLQAAIVHHCPTVVAPPVYCCYS